METCPICQEPVRDGWLAIHLESHGLPAMVRVLAQGPSVVRVYQAQTPSGAEDRFAAEAPLFAECGYQPVDRRWGTADPTARDYGLFGPIALVVGRGPWLAVTFARTVEPVP